MDFAQSCYSKPEASGLVWTEKLGMADTINNLDLGPLTFSKSLLFAISTLFSSATMMFLSAPNLKLSATTLESYCYDIRFILHANEPLSGSHRYVLP